MANALLSSYQQAQDAWQRKMELAVAMAIGDWLIASGLDLTKPILSLKREYLIGMGVAACAAYTATREEERRRLNIPTHGDPLQPDPLDPLDPLLGSLTPLSA
jgi:hypothetical protein